MQYFALNSLRENHRKAHEHERRGRLLRGFSFSSDESTDEIENANIFVAKIKEAILHCL